MAGRVSVSAADFVRSIGHWQNEALRRPISITHHGRERLVLAAPAEFNPSATIHAAAAASVEGVRADADAVVDNLEDGFLAFDASLQVKRMNPAAEAFIGRSRDAIHGSAADFIAPPLGVVLNERLQRVMRARKREKFETAVDDRHIRVCVFPLAEGAAILFTNITEQHDQRVRLGVGDALCAATDRHPRAAAATLDAAGRVTDIHAGFCEWLGFRRDDLIGQPLFDLAAPEQRVGVGEVFAAALAGTAAKHVAVTLLGKHEREVRGTLSLAAVRSGAVSNGAVAVMVLEDVIQDAA